MTQNEFVPYPFVVEGVADNKAFVRVVPGDGSCLFAAIASSLWFIQHGNHPCFGSSAFQDLKDQLRDLAVTTLSEISGPSLHLEGSETISRRDLLLTAAAQQELSMDEYCEWLRNSRSWGGGPEIVALANALRRPIFIYEASYVAPSVDYQRTRTERVQRPGSIDVGSTGTTSSNSITRCYPSGILRRGNSLNTSPIASVTNYFRDRWSALTSHRSSAETSIQLKASGFFGWPAFANEEPIHLLFTNVDFPYSAQRALPNHFNSIFLF